MLLKTKTFRNTFFKDTFLFCLVGFLVVHQLYGQYFSAEKTYRAGIHAFNDKNYYSARLLFQEILHKEVSGRYSDKSQYYLALTYYYEKDYQSSIFELKTFLRDYPSSKLTVKARYWIGESYYYLKKYTQAREIHYQLVREHKEDPITAYALYTIGYSYIKDKRYDEAITELNRALKNHPSSKISHETSLQLGMAYFYNVEYEEARKVFQNIILNYNDSNLSQKAQLWIGKSFFIEKNYAEAIRQFNFILDKKPNQEIVAETIYHIALIKFHTKDIDSSIHLLKSILEKHRSWSKLDRAYFRLGQIFYKNAVEEETLRYLKIFLHDYKNSVYYADGLSIYTEVAQNKQSVQQIISFLDKILSSGLEAKQYLKVLHKKADILFQAQLFQDALTIYEEAYKKTPESDKGEILYMKAQACYKLNLYEQAIENTAKIVKNKTYVLWKPDAYFLEAEIYFALGDYTNSLQRYHQVVRFYTKHRRGFDASMGIGWVYFELKQYARSRDTFKKLLKKYKNPKQNIKIRMALAACEYNLRDFSNAVKTYQAIIEQKKIFPKEAEEALFRMGWARYREQKYYASNDLFFQYQKRYPQGAFFLEAKYFAAWGHFYNKKYEKAGLTFLRTLQNSPKENVFYRKASLQYAKIAYILKNYEKACTTITKIIEKFPQAEEIEESLYVGANCSLKLKNPKRASHFLKKLRQVAPNSSYVKEILYSVANYYEKYKDFDKAHELLKEVARQSDNESEKWHIKISRCDLLIVEKDYSAAANILKSILENKNDELIPYKPETLNRLFELYFKTNSSDKIFQGFEQYKNIFDSSKNMTSELKVWEGRVWMKKKNYEKSNKVFKDLLSNKKYGITARYYLGMGYYQQKQWGKAHDFLKQVAEKSKDKLASQARFKVAEIYFIQKKHENALLQYTKVVYLYSDVSDIYETSLYKIILCFKILKKEKGYIKYLTKLTEEFPTSTYLLNFKENPFKKTGKKVKTTSPIAP